MTSLISPCSHISNIFIEASQKVGVLLRLRNLIPCKAKLIIYKSSILPHLTYCHLVWHNCRSSDSRKIERIQERELRTYFVLQDNNHDRHFLLIHFGKSKIIIKYIISRRAVNFVFLILTYLLLLLKSTF